ERETGFGTNAEQAVDVEQRSCRTVDRDAFVDLYSTRSWVATFHRRTSLFRQPEREPDRKPVLSRQGGQLLCRDVGHVRLAAPGSDRRDEGQRTSQRERVR